MQQNKSKQFSIGPQVWDIQSGSKSLVMICETRLLLHDKKEHSLLIGEVFEKKKDCIYNISCKYGKEYKGETCHLNVRRLEHKQYPQKKKIYCARQHIGLNLCGWDPNDLEGAHKKRRHILACQSREISAQCSFLCLTILGWLYG